MSNSNSSSSNNNLPLSTTDLQEEVKIRMGTSGAAALPPKTVLQVFQATVEKLGDAPALYQKRPNPTTVGRRHTLHT